MRTKFCPSPRSLWKSMQNPKRFWFCSSDFSLSVPIDFREKIFVRTTTDGALDYSHDFVLLGCQPPVSRQFSDYVSTLRPVSPLGLS
jgi:hypothetical protein